MKKNYNKIVFDLSRRYSGTKYAKVVESAVTAYLGDDYDKFDELVNSLPDDLTLLEGLVTKLKGKSVYTNLRKLLEKKETSVEQELISTASLIVHAGIEMKENKEFKCLLPDLYKKLGGIINKL